IVGESVEEVPLTELRKGDLVLIRPGTNVSADGVVKDGNSAVNESMITGESAPVTKRGADSVIAGTINGSGPLRVEVTRTGYETAVVSRKLATSTPCSWIKRARSLEASSASSTSLRSPA